MHTLAVVLAGLISLFIFIFVTSLINKRRNLHSVDGARIFIWFWLAASAVNFYIGVFVVHYSFTTELVVHIIVFGLPAGLAWHLSRKFRSRHLV